MIRNTVPLIGKQSSDDSSTKLKSKSKSIYFDFYQFKLYIKMCLVSFVEKHNGFPQTFI